VPGSKKPGTIVQSEPSAVTLDCRLVDLDGLRSDSRPGEFVNATLTTSGSESFGAFHVSSEVVDSGCEGGLEGRDIFWG